MLFIFELIAFALLAYFVGTQVILPVLRGIPLFPVFRFRKQFSKLEDAAAAELADALEREIVNRSRERAKEQK